MKFKELRERAGYTQLELATRLKVDRTTVAKWEAGKAFPTSAKLPRVAEELRCEITELYEKTESPAG